MGFSLFGAGDAPFVAGVGASRVYWLRPSLLWRFCGGRPDFRCTGVGRGSDGGVSRGVDSDTGGGTTASSTGVSSGASVSAQRSANVQGWFEYFLPSAFLRSARPFRRLAASVLSRSRSLSRNSFSRWLRAAAPRGFCLVIAGFVESSSDSRTGDPLGDLELVRCRLTSGLTL